MKFFTKNKIIGGTLALMALVSIINTQAILRLTDYVKGDSARGLSLSSEGQEAQVFRSSSSCLKLSPASNNRTTFIDPASFSEDFDGLSKHMFLIGFKIKNTCNQTISIVKDSFAYPNGTGSFSNSKLEDFPNILNQTASSNFSFSGPTPANTESIWGILSPDLIVPNQNLSGVTITGDGEMKVANIPANGEREFIVSSYANAGLNEHHTRLSLKNIRWFTTSSYGDGQISNGEMKTYALTKAEVEKYTTSYARFKSSAQSSDDCAEGTIIGYDSAGNPIFCGNEDVGDDCAKGTIIGYNKDGTPIYCQ